MKSPQHNRGGPTVRLCSLVISTKVRSAAEFRLSDTEFDRPRGTGLVGHPARKTSLKAEREPSGKKTGKMVVRMKSTFHLIEYGAIVVTTRRNESDDWIETIKLDPALALHRNSSHLLHDGDLARARALLKKLCSPMVADAADVCHLVPSACPKHREPVASIRSIDCELWYPSIELAHLHSLRHPEAGSSRGRKQNYARLVPEVTEAGDGVGAAVGSKPPVPRSSGCSICLERVSRRSDGLNLKVSGLKICLELKDDALTRRVRCQPGTMAKVRDKMRVVHLELEDVQRVCREVVSELEGFYLPVPPEWSANPGTSKLARMIALIAATTERTPDEVVMNASAGRQVCRRTARRLEKAVREEMNLLKKLPLAEALNIPASEVVDTSRCNQPLATAIDPQVAAVCGPGTTSH